MSNVSEAFEQLLANLAEGQERADRLGRLLGSLWDETGHPTILALPEARALVSYSMTRAADNCATLGIELNDTRWTGVVALLHNAGTRVSGGVSELTADEARQVSALLGGLQYRVRQLRVKRSGEAVTVRLS